MASWSQIPTFVRDPRGRVLINPAKDYMRPFEFRMDSPNAIITLAAGEQLGPFLMTARHDGPIEVFYIKANVYNSADVPVTTTDMRVLIEHPGKMGTGKQYMNRPIRLFTIVGDAGRPYVLPETIFIQAQQSLNWTFFNDDSAERKVEIVCGSVKFYPQRATPKIAEDLLSYMDRRERTYTYWQTTDEAVVIDASDTDFDAFFTSPDDADLEIFKLTAHGDGAFRAQIKDGQTDEGITVGKVHGSLLFGGRVVTALSGGLGGSGGMYPARWPTTWLQRRSVKGQFVIDNLTAQENELSLVLGGRKISYT